MARTKIAEDAERGNTNGKRERPCSDDTSADEGKEMKKSDSSGEKKTPATSNSFTGAKPKTEKAQKNTTNKRKKSVSEEEMEDLCGELDERGKDLDVKIRETIESFNNLEFYPSRAGL